jgi:hypothetical protein
LKELWEMLFHRSLFGPTRFASFLQKGLDLKDPDVMWLEPFWHRLRQFYDQKS